MMARYSFAPALGGGVGRDPDRQAIRVPVQCGAFYILGGVLQRLFRRRAKP